MSIKVVKFFIPKSFWNNHEIHTVLVRELARLVNNDQFHTNLLLNRSCGVHGDVLEFVRSLASTGFTEGECMAVGVKLGITVWSVKQHLPFVGEDAVPFQGVGV